MIYNYHVKDASDELVSLDEYKGRVVLIVNTATQCGLTPQYEGLQKLYEKFKDRGFEILDFPSNQFLEQAPGTNEEISEFCKTNYGTTFKQFKKIDVNGPGADELYKYLRSQAPQAHEDEQSIGLYEKLLSLGFQTQDDEIKWNFTKFLINREGKVVGRFAPTYPPEKLEKVIEALL